MVSRAREDSVHKLQTLPGVGKRIAQDLYSVGIHSIAQLKHSDPERLYRTLCKRAGHPIDRCMLYVFRCAIYAASHPRPDSDPAIGPPPTRCFVP